MPMHYGVIHIKILHFSLRHSVVSVKNCLSNEQIFIYNRFNSTIFKLTCVTWLAIVTDTLEFSIVDCLLKHAQKDHSSNPKLNPKQVSPVTRRQSQPQHAHNHIDDAHHHVELKTMDTDETDNWNKNMSESFVNERTQHAAQNPELSHVKITYKIRP